MAEEKKVNNEATETKAEEAKEIKEETKGNEPEDQAEDNQDKGAENPPANVEKPKKKNFLEKAGDKINELKDAENHPIASKVINTGEKIAKGLPWAIGGAIVTVGTMAYVAKETMDTSNSEDDTIDDDEDIIDSDGAELDDSDDSES